MHETSTKKTELQQIHAIVKGRVQGVGFRATVVHFAKQLKLHGTVRNLPDNSVEIYVHGPKNIIQELFLTLHREFGSSNISNIEQTEVNPYQVYEDFHVIY